MARKQRTRDHERPSSSRSRRWIVFSLAVMALILMSVVMLYRSPVQPKNVVIISIDTLHAGHLSCYGYQRIQTPNIDRLAREGVLFENAATSVPLTLPAHASIFTGRSPLRHGVVDNFTSFLGDEEETLAEVLEAHGYATGAFVGAYVLDSSWGTAQGFDVYFDDFDTQGSNVRSVEANQRTGDEVLERVLPWIRGQGGTPFFLFVHFFDPHEPYDPPEPYRTNCNQNLVGCYDGEIAFVDSLVGRLVSELESLGVLEESLVILLGDHGESLGDHGESTHGFFLYDATVKVPLIISGPGIPGSARVQSQVRTVDMLPTVLDLLGLPSPGSVDGVSLRPLLFDPDGDLQLLAYIESQYPQLQFGWAPLSGLRNERYKFVDAPRRELYDLSVDPKETRNLADDRSDIIEKLAAELEMIRAQTAAAKREPHLPDPQTAERLRALGYVTSTAAASSSTSPGDLDDPKDKIDVFNRLDDARVVRRSGDTEGALGLLTAVLEEDPDVMLAHLMLGNIYLETGEYKKAEAAFRKVLSRNDEHLEALFGMARAHQRSGRYREAVRGLEHCLEIDPRQARAVRALAEVRLAMGQGQEVERLIRGLSAEEQDDSVKLLLAGSLLVQKKQREALDILERIAQQGSDDEQVLLSLGSLFLKAGEEERALAAYRRAVQVPDIGGVPSREQAEVFNGVGHLLARQGDFSSSAQAFRKAVQRDPSLASGDNNLGIVLAQMEQFDAAERAFQKAIEKVPDFAEAYYNLGCLYLQTGRKDRAIPALRRALDVKPDYDKARAKLEQALAGVPDKR